MNFLLTRRGDLVSTDRQPTAADPIGWRENRNRFIDPAVRGDILAQKERVVVGVTVRHPELGDHVVYIDRKLLRRGIPPTMLHETLCDLLEQRIPRHRNTPRVTSPIILL